MCKHRAAPLADRLQQARTQSNGTSRSPSSLPSSTPMPSASKDVWTRFVEGFTRFLDRFKIPMAILWIGVLALAAAFGPAALTSTSNSWKGAPSAESTQALDRLQQHFPAIGKSAAVALVVHALGPAQNCTDPALAQFERQLGHAVAAYEPHVLVAYSGYFTAQDAGLLNAASFITPDAQYSVITVIGHGDPGSAVTVDFAKFIKSQIRALSHSLFLDNTFSFVLTGPTAFVEDVNKAIASDTSKLDTIVLPIAFTLMAVFVGSLRLLVIPFLCIPIIILTSFAIVTGLTKVMLIPSFVPSFLLSILMSLSIDYALFMLMRYREALDSGIPHRKAVDVMLLSAGKTVLVSGGTLTLCFVAFCFIPVPILVAVGAASSLALVVTMTTYFTLSPLLLLLFPNFFAKCAAPSRFWPPSAWVHVLSKSASSPVPTPRTVIVTSASNGSDAVEVPVADNKGSVSLPVEKSEAEAALVAVSQSEEFELAALKKSLWWRCGEKALRWPYNLLCVVVILGLTIPFDLKALSMTNTETFQELLPRGSPSLDGFDQLVNSFGYGEVFTYRLLVVPPPGVSAYSQATFNAVASIIPALVAAPGVTETRLSDFEAAPFFQNAPVSFAAMEACVANPASDTVHCPTYLFLRGAYIAADSSAMYVQFKPVFDPSGLFGKSWLKAMRAAMKQQAADTGYSLYLAGAGADAADMITTVFDAMPTVAGATAAVMFVFIAISFRSLLIALRAVLTVALTLSWAFGFVWLIYGPYGALAWLGTPALSRMPGIYWLSPVLAFGVMVGVSLDYDVFITVRIKEFRMEGYDNRTSILLALTKTGGVITAAGVIMAISFSGLLASSTPLLNIIGAYLFWSVLFDTFIVRSILVPAIMHLLGDVAWWPLLPGAPTKFMPGKTAAAMPHTVEASV